MFRFRSIALTAFAQAATNTALNRHAIWQIDHLHWPAHPYRYPTNVGGAAK